MPKLDPAAGAWGRFVTGSIRTQADLRRALRKSVQLARDEASDRHLRVMVLGPAQSGKSTLIAVLRRLATSLGFPRMGLEVYEDAVGSPSAARVAWQVVPGGPEDKKRLVADMRKALARRGEPKPELVVILTKQPKEITPEIASQIRMMDVLVWATEGANK